MQGALCSVCLGAPPQVLRAGEGWMEAELLGAAGILAALGFR